MLGSRDRSLVSMDASIDKVDSDLIFDDEDDVVVNPVSLIGVKKFVEVKVKVK